MKTKKPTLLSAVVDFLRSPPGVMVVVTSAIVILDGAMTLATTHDPRCLFVKCVVVK